MRSYIISQAQYNIYKNQSIIYKAQSATYKNKHSTSTPKKVATCLVANLEEQKELDEEMPANIQKQLLSERRTKVVSSQQTSAPYDETICNRSVPFSCNIVLPQGFRLAPSFAPDIAFNTEGIECIIDTCTQTAEHIPHFDQKEANCSGSLQRVRAVGYIQFIVSISNITGNVGRDLAAISRLGSVHVNHTIYFTRAENPCPDFSNIVVSELRIDEDLSFTTDCGETVLNIKGTFELPAYNESE
ncbi:hypothetical protein P4S83_03585 [Aneurinibacillus thermoaerophilus]|nr:hypothetical protein [Aneurinibacillus thermoaerophilus]